MRFDGFEITIQAEIIDQFQDARNDERRARQGRDTDQRRGKDGRQVGNLQPYLVATITWNFAGSRLPVIQVFKGRSSQRNP